MSDLIAIVIQEAGKPRRAPSVHPMEALPSFQRIWKDELVEYYACNEKGERIEQKVKVFVSKQEKAFDALKEKAQKLKIKGYQKMGFDTLLKAVQEASNKAETKPA